MNLYTLDQEIMDTRKLLNKFEDSEAKININLSLKYLSDETRRYIYRANKIEEAFAKLKQRIKDELQQRGGS